MGEVNSVKVSIGNRSYPLRITSEEGEKVTEAAQAINKRLKELEESYAVKDKQDLLAMCALQFATEAINQAKQGGKKEDNEEVTQQVEYLGTLIDDYLASESPSPDEGLKVL